MSLTAWEGHVSAVVWLQGCNFQCPACPVPHLVPRGGDLGTIPLSSVLESVYRRRRWLDAVVVAGGEPTLHEGLPELLAMLKQFGLPVRLHTNGSHPEVLREVIESGDVASVALTLRGPLDPTYSVAAGTRVRLSEIYESVEALLSGGCRYEFRIPWLAGVVEHEQMIAVVRMLAGARKVVLEGSPDGSPGPRRLRRVAKSAGHLVESCVVAGKPSDDFGALARGSGVVS